MQNRLEEAERSAMEANRKIVIKLEERCRALEHDMEVSQSQQQEQEKRLRHHERMVRELQFQVEEDQKMQQKQQELAEKLELKLKSYKKQMDEAVNIIIETLSWLILANFSWITKVFTC